ncbi:hypothetical protein [Paenibacillus naphthalenovorans]|uniref:hypothetical protein n=1 Tax=Paenibacillus naphthalenovorans TaxID=162209 RepID=UPI003D285D3C
MLSFEEKRAVVESFPELERKNVSLGRINYHYEKSAHDKKIVVYHLHPNGNGFVYAGLLYGYDQDDKGLVKIRDFSKEQLHAIIEASIRSLSPRTTEEQAIIGDAKEERWIGPDNHTLVLLEEDEMWYVYSGLHLESAFDTYDEAIEYLHDEGFSRM